MNLSILLSILAGILLLVGFIGTFVPILPGCPLAWGGLLAAYFSTYNHISIICLVITGIVAVVVSILDSFLPSLMTKKSGASKASVRGSTIGIIVGIFLGPVGIILGPFVGALIGELIHTNGDFSVSFKSAVSAFLGFIFGTGMKMIVVAIYIVIFIGSFK